MKKFLFAIAAIVFATTAEAKWFEKPVNCSTSQEVYKELIDPYELKPMIAGVTNIIAPNMPTYPAAMVFYANTETGRYLIIEVDEVSTCILAIGDGLDFNINEDEVRNLLLENSGT